MTNNKLVVNMSLINTTIRLVYYAKMNGIKHKKVINSASKWKNIRLLSSYTKEKEEKVWRNLSNHLL